MKSIHFSAIKRYLLLWATQSLSALGSGMTSYALVLWLYEKTGSALQTALLSVCSYAPYVVMSIFAGALSDRWNKKRTMLLCDLFAALCTIAVLALIKTDTLSMWHLYLLNAVSGLMNTVGQPAAETAATMLVPKEYYQQTSGLRGLSQSLNTILTPILAAALFSLVGIEAVIAADLFTFAVAFITLWAFIPIPEPKAYSEKPDGILRSAKEALRFIRDKRLILYLILFLGCINLTASMYEAVLPALILSKQNAAVLGAINASAGVAALIGSAVAVILPAPRNRVAVICLSLLISMGTENLLLAFSGEPVVWCIGAVLGWLPIPIMNANMDVIFRTLIPPDMQGRVWACRNTLQFCTIPAGLILGGVLTDAVFEPFVSGQNNAVLSTLFGEGKGSGAAMLFFIIGVVGVLTAVIFSVILKKYRFSEK